VQFSGGSCIVDSHGNVLASCDSGDRILSAELQLPEENPQLKKRRPELYQRLITNTFFWNPQDFFGLYGRNPLPDGKASRIAVAQFRPQNDVDVNLAQIRHWAEQAKSGGAELLVLPERALTGGDGSRYALTLDDAPVQALIALAMELDIALLAGFAEREGEQCYNSAVLVSSDGMNAHYRQIHVSEQDRQWACAGNQWVTCDLPCGRVGILLGKICWCRKPRGFWRWKAAISLLARRSFIHLCQWRTRARPSPMSGRFRAAPILTTGCCHAFARVRIMSGWLLPTGQPPKAKALV
jgi:hypothetical protein